MRLTSGLILVATLLSSSFPLAGSCLNASVASGSVARKAARRLPSEVVPTSYDLRLKPDLDTATFSGVETVAIKVSQPVTQIVLHSKDIHITRATLAPASGGSEQEEKVELMPSDEMVAFQSSQTVGPGDYLLHLTFDAKLNDKLVGFYKSTFKDDKGKEHSLAVTQFEPADARRMFPCFDEPQLKAHFKISVDTKKDLAVISNAPVDKETIEANGSKLVQFAETPLMSTYLLAVLVGDFEATPPVVIQGVPVRVWSVKGRSALGTYSRDTAAKLLPALTSYFGIDYPWTKLDLVAIPDFEAGAMENPGAITFRETLLLIDPKTASSSSQRSAASVIAHEMAHLWFGDLVTMKWWDDLWLNEAFATWMSTRAVNAIHPDWEFWKGYSGDRVASLETDSLHSTRAIHSPVASPEQAHEMFDVITYEKGASVLRMLEKYVDEHNFQSGIHKYLSDHSFANATTDDLWDAIGTVSGAPVRQIMNGWVNQPGYPLLTMNKVEGKPNLIRVKQQRFFMAGPDPTNTTIWQVPIGVRSLGSSPAKNDQTDAQKKLLLDANEKTFDLAGAEPFFANAGGVGYYRVNYPKADAAAIKQKLESQLDPIERLTYLDDTWNLAKAGNVPIEQYLDLLSAFKAETDETVWGSILGDLHYLDYYVADGSRPQYQALIREVLKPISQKLGWIAKPGETQQRRILRGSVLTVLGTTGHDTEVASHARKLFAQYLKDKTKVDPDLVSAISTIVAYNGTSADFATFKKLYETAKTPEEEHRNLYVLPIFDSPALVAKTLDMSINGTVRMQDAPGLLGSLLGRRQTSAVAWQFLQKNWTKITGVYSEQMVPRVVSRTGAFNTAASYQELKTFLAAHPVPSGESTVARALESVRINVGFRQRSAKHLNEWLKRHCSGV